MGTDQQHRPSWLTGPCPVWCDAEHREEDHVEDRVHRDSPSEVSGVLGRVDETTLRVGADAAVFVVQRVQHADDPQDWVLLTEAEDTSRSLLLTPESVERLVRALQTRSGRR